MASSNFVESSIPVPMAPIPYKTLPASLGRTRGTYLLLVRTFLTEYRDTWWLHVFFGFLMPMGMIFFLKMLGGESISPDRAAFLIGGNMTTSIAYGPAMLLINKIGWGRHNRSFEYWAALPVGKLVLIMAIVTVSLIFAIPGILAVYLLGSLILGVSLSFSPVLVVLIPLGALSLSGFGALLGAYAKDGPTANILANALIGFVTFLSPTMVPLDSMPVVLRVTSYFVPTTYVSNAFRAALQGNIGLGLAYDVSILVLFTVFFMALVHRKLDWRGA